MTMRIVLLCATRRGELFLDRLAALVPDAELVVFTFPEDPWEPPFRAGIQAVAAKAGALVYEARDIGRERWLGFWQTTPIDLMFAVSWRYLIPEHVYRLPRLGSFAFHDSLLPAYRGFAPTVWAMINGEDHTGVTLFEIADDVDSGDIIAQQRVPIGPDDTIAGVMERVTRAYLDVLEAALPALLDGTAPRVPQDHTRATFTCKRVPNDNRIDWSQPATRVYNLIRAVTSPYPGAFTLLDGQKLIVWEARPLPDFRPYVGRVPGRVVEVRPGAGSVVLAGDGALLLTQVQLGDGPIQPADETLNRISLTLGR